MMRPLAALLVAALLLIAPQAHAQSDLNKTIADIRTMLDWLRAEEAVSQSVRALVHAIPAPRAAAADPLYLQQLQAMGEAAAAGRTRLAALRAQAVNLPPTPSFNDPHYTAVVERERAALPAHIDALSGLLDALIA